MIGMESHIYTNSWINYNPRDKILFTLSTMILGTLSQSLLQALPIILGVGIMVLFMVKIPFASYLKFISIPLSFIIFAALAVAISVSLNRQGMVWCFNLGAYYAGFTTHGLHQASLILGRSISTLSCLAFLVFTTPVEDVAGQLERWKMPYLLIELMILIYRFLFVFWDQALTIKTAQTARLGYVGFNNSMKSLSLLLSGLFVQVLARSNSLYESLVSRGYDQSLRVLREEYAAIPGSMVLLLVSFDVMLLLTVIFY